MEAGGSLLAGGGPPEDPELADGFFYSPTVVVDPPHDSPMAVEEVFGPALPVWRISGLEEGIARANASRFGLGSSVWTRDLARARAAADRIEAGYTWINSRTKVYDELPFGGWKSSGYGKEHGEEAFDFYTETKSVVFGGGRGGVRGGVSRGRDKSDDIRRAPWDAAALPVPLIPVERTFEGFLGLQWLELTEEAAHVRFAVREDLKQPLGLLHGGIYCAVAESVASVATVRAVWSDGKTGSGLSNSASFLRPMTCGVVDVRARCRGHDEREWTWSHEFRDERERLCALVDVTIAVRDMPK